ncbi:MULTISPECIES: transporter substrate-binding domain-containing protein [unclassified Pseudoalteromonas]|uniref:transporter substrate-binding domain-containing protein n=1 Tax=unclassified Pseudoalteromonas TaxID=194690 RepID=UPI0007516AD7|nr:MULTISPECIES: transporter substrate-binding domain-containing protein [unclassified Pseudoalteromonas]
MNMKVVCLLFFFMGTSTYANNDVLTIRYQSPANDYIAELFVLVLDKSGQKFNCIPVKDLPSQKRTILLLGKDKSLDLFWTVTNVKREEQALAVKIPLDRGLLGYRIPLINKRTPDLFKNKQNTIDIRKVHFGLRFDWPDLEIFKQNELSILSFSSHSQANNLLKSGRIDAIPDGLLEVGSYKLQPELTYDKHVVLYYPSAVYFFVAKENQVLHDALEKGLNLSLKDGSWQKLFDKHFSHVIENVNLAKRTLIRLDNPTLPRTAPIDISEYWYNTNNKVSNE